MSDHTLTDKQIAELWKAHGEETDKRLADRIKAVYHLGRGWSSREVADALLMDRTTVLNHFRRYQRGGLEKLRSWEYQGSDSYLTDEEREALKRTLEERLFLTAAEVVAYIEERWGVRYSVEGVTKLLGRLGYVYKKAKGIPGKADAEKQEAFVAEYKELKAEIPTDTPIYFSDAVHPLHNPVISQGWIKKGQEREIRSNTGRRRLNIHGAIDIQTTAAVIRYEDWVNAEAVIRLLQDIAQSRPDAPVIYFICDNAPYYRAKAVTEYLKTSRIKIIFLPPYSPNLNLIERLWKYFKRNVLYNQYYPTFDKFKNACRGFFENLGDHSAKLRTLLAENFEIISA